MSHTDPSLLALALADTLPRSADRRSELVAIGMLATAVICEGPNEERAELVEAFCNILRTGVAQQLN
jgi:hypothetical protein